MLTLVIILFIGGLFRLLLGLIWAILFVVTLMDLFNSLLPANTKLLWLIVILVAPILGCLIYLFWGKQQRL
jgi:hypothetical protein